MTRRIIGAQPEGDGDGRLTPELQAALTERLAAILETGDWPAFYAEIMEMARRTAQQISPEEQQSLLAYPQTLPEPARTMLTLRRRGMSPSEIARCMNLQPKAVCRALARIYSDMRFLLD
jgi:DNA-directed RNA polymerase specialized sigma24 family protein